jgi:hypothetical protein
MLHCGGPETLKQNNTGVLNPACVLTVVHVPLAAGQVINKVPQRDAHTAEGDLRPATQ